MKKNKRWIQIMKYTHYKRIYKRCECKMLQAHSLTPPMWSFKSPPQPLNVTLTCKYIINWFNNYSFLYIMSHIFTIISLTIEMLYLLLPLVFCFCCNYSNFYIYSNYYTYYYIIYSFINLLIN